MGAPGAFDADTPEGEKGYSSQYINKKDVIKIGIVLVVVVLLGIPVFKIMKEKGDETVCRKNLLQAWSAIGVYAEGYDGRFPPMYEVGDNGSPALDQGLPVVWASVISGYLQKGVTLTCPAADSSENTKVNGQVYDTSKGSKGKLINSINLSYGMYMPLSTRPSSDFRDPASTVLLTETANDGAMKTYDPNPFTNSDGERVPFDGFMVGWDTTNFYNPKNMTGSFDAAKVTRLAFYNTSDGNFGGKDVKARHGSRLFAIYVDGSLGHLKGNSGNIVKRGGNRVSDYWSPD